MLGTIVDFGIATSAATGSRGSSQEDFCSKMEDRMVCVGRKMQYKQLKVRLHKSSIRASFTNQYMKRLTFNVRFAQYFLPETGSTTSSHTPLSD